MKSLTLCQACKRHVKLSETECPFCSAAVQAPRAPKSALRPRGLPGGRAALFLAGTALAPGCADEPEPEVDSGFIPVPPYGIAIPPTDAGKDAGVGNIVPVYGAAVPVYGVAIYDSGFIPVPPYGIAIPPEDAGPADAGPKDAGCPQVGNLPVPVYGIPVDSGTRMDQCTDKQDAGKDAGVAIIGFPPYGIPPEGGR